MYMKSSTRMKFCFSLLTTLLISIRLAGAFLQPFSRNEPLRRTGYHGVTYEVSFDSSQTVSRCSRERPSSPLRMGIGDVFSKAFANEDMGPKKENPGIKSNLKWCMVTVNGKTVKAVQGQRLRDIIAAAGAKIEYGCEKGTCGTCESLVDGKKTRVCKAIVPRNKDKVNIKTKFG